ncbi:MAG: hypothetical protein PVG45_12860, partial [Gammaproteobacteria bacterium]
MSLKTSSLTGVITAVALLLSITTASAEEATKAPANKKANDPHYTPAGFFDIHVCNWPDRELFFMPLFSTVRYDEITALDVH